MKRYECYTFESLHNNPIPQADMREADDGAYVLYTDAVKMQREAFVTGAYWAEGEIGDGLNEKPEAEAARRYKEE